MSNRLQNIGSFSSPRTNTTSIDRDTLRTSSSARARGHAQDSLRPMSHLDKVTDSTQSRKLDARLSTGSQPLVDQKAFTRILYSSTSPTLALGSKGPAIVELKRLLNGTRGFLQSKLDLSSDVYDEKTAAAVVRFQRGHALTKDFKVLTKPGLCCDGVAGKWTITALLIKNGYEVPAERSKNLIARIEKSPGEQWVESTKYRAVEITKTTKQINSYQGVSAIGKEKFPFQRHSYDCGPTACGTALGILTGKDKEALAAQFRVSQGKTGMSWENPHKFAKQAGISCVQLNTSDPERIAHYLRNGCTAVVSIKKTSPLTENGHILALHRVRGKGADLQFENLDPNSNNLPRYSILPANQISKEVRQVWVFGQRDLLAKLSQKPHYLASR